MIEHTAKVNVRKARRCEKSSHTRGGCSGSVVSTYDVFGVCITAGSPFCNGINGGSAMPRAQRWHDDDVLQLPISQDGIFRRPPRQVSLFLGLFQSILHLSTLPPAHLIKQPSPFALYLPRHPSSLPIPASPPLPPRLHMPYNLHSMPPRSRSSQRDRHMSPLPSLSAHSRAYCMNVQTRPGAHMHSSLRRCRCLRVSCGMLDWERRGKAVV